MATLLLEGCAPTPVIAYLKALGILRVVSEQVDPAATGAWTARGFALTSTLDLDDLVTFLTERYQPTPIVAPWNGRSGFFAANYDRSSEQLVTRLEQTDDPRLARLRDAIAVGRQLHGIGVDRGWLGIDAKGKVVVADKEACIAFCRNHLPDEAVAWLDAVAALGDDGAAYSILLGGSGGNLGSLDLTNNWYQHLVTVLLDGQPEAVTRLGRDSLTGTATQPAVKAAVGQLDPGRAGGVGRQRDDDKGGAASWVNPWDFVLGLEGSLMFASAVARRAGREGGRGRTAMPFTVAGTTAGARGAAAAESIRGEVWLPLWTQPATHPELARLFGEARVQWDGWQAGTGLDFASAVATLGTDRGLTAFERLSVAERLGQSSLTASAGRVAVAARPEVRSTRELDRWLRSVEQAQSPGQVAAALRSARQAQWQVAEHGGPDRLAAFLTAVADVETAVARSGRLRDVVRPVTGPAAEEVIREVTDPESVIAIGLASLRDPRTPRPRTPVEQAHALRSCVSPVQLEGGRWAWSGDRPPPVPGVDIRPVPEVLADVLAFRFRKDRADDDRPSADVELIGAEPWFAFGWPVRQEAAELLARGEVDLRRLRDRLRGLLLLDWEYSTAPPPATLTAGPPPPHPLYRLLAPFFSARAVPLSLPGRTTPLTVRLRPEPGWARLLQADAMERLATSAVSRMGVAGLSPAVSHPDAVAALARSATVRPDDRSAPGPRLAAAVLLQLTGRSYGRTLAHTTTRTAVPVPSTDDPEDPDDDPRT